MWLTLGGRHAGSGGGPCVRALHEAGRACAWPRVGMQTIHASSSSHVQLHTACSPRPPLMTLTHTTARHGRQPQRQALCGPTQRQGMTAITRDSAGLLTASPASEALRVINLTCLRQPLQAKLPFRITASGTIMSARDGLMSKVAVKAELKSLGDTRRCSTHV